MASNNFLNVKTHLSAFKNNSEKDTLSEASESGTSNSVTSAEDLQKLAVILGLNSAEDVYQERFRVDRRRLEGMLAEHLADSQTAQAFFHRVMVETNTLINWPARLKIGARSKKDPHVRVAGRPDDVKLAREKIMQLLDTRNNRVTMKIDVSYTDHSHIIGKGGLTIKRVMEETGCHIHFPDSNRTSAVEKSNQVSIAGDMERVERARARVRVLVPPPMPSLANTFATPKPRCTARPPAKSVLDVQNNVNVEPDEDQDTPITHAISTSKSDQALTPLVFSFELPVTAPTQPLPDLASPYVQQIQEQYNVQVMLRNRAKLHANLLMVKGVQWEVQATMEATTLLMNYMCGSLASQTQVHMTLEISPMHHRAVVGPCSEQLKAIMVGAGAQVMFPDAADPNIAPLKRSCVTISGQIKNVYAARQQLVGSLPLVVIFDVPDEACRADNDDVVKLMQKYNVFINIKRKPKQGIASIVIRGIERCAGDIYEARRELLGGKEPAIAAEVPESYNIPPNPNYTYAMFNAFSPNQSNSLFNNMPEMGSPFNNMPEMGSPFNNMPEMGSPFNKMPDMGSPFNNMPDMPLNMSPFNNPPTPGGYPSPMSPLVTAPAFPWMIPSPQPTPAPFSFPNMMPNPNSVMYSNQGGSWNPMSNNGEIMQPPAMPQAAFHHLTAERPITLSQLLNSSSQASSGYQSNFTGSTVSLETHNNSGGDGSNMVSPSVSPISKPMTSPARSTEADRSQHEIASIVSDVPLSERRAPGCEKKTLETLKMSPLADYRSMKAEASKAMREDVGSGYRVPTPRWAGHYFSHTSPGHINLSETSADAMATPEKTWNRSELVRPKIVETAPTPPPAPRKPCRYTQLLDLLGDVGLHKYIDLFKKHELDLSTFASLNEADLIEIGVTAFGARRKMLLVIAELQKQAGTPKASTSGVERKLVNSPPQYNTAAAALAQDKIW